MAFATLTTADGQRLLIHSFQSIPMDAYLFLAFSVFFRFREECKAAGKSIMVWTVNEPAHMMEVCHRFSSKFYDADAELYRL
jgi:hypothetical protein